MAKIRCSCGKFMRETQAQCKKCFKRDFLFTPKKTRRSSRRKLSLANMLTAGAIASMFLNNIKLPEDK